ncbi:MAG TPA: glycerate kinase [Candidatus Limnocylindrales bacterium]
MSRAQPGAPAGRPLTVLIAPDSFKGSLTSVQVTQALATGWRRARPGDTVLLSPLADGGEGTLAAIEAAGGWTWRQARVCDPIRRPIVARWLQSEDGLRAVVEMAEASGLSRLAPDERDPVGATSVGTGELIEAAYRAGARSILLGIGGSATTDGGLGLLQGLAAYGAGLELASLDPRVHEIELEVACDVTNPLLGPNGAAATYGPQKGATPDQVRELDAALGRFADEIERAIHRRERDTPGAGAAGGVGFALLAIKDQFASFALRPGVDLVMQATGFQDKLAHADLVITGEGRVDEQTAFGKTALGVAKRAAAIGVPVIAVGGGVTPGGIEAMAAVGSTVVPVSEHAQSIEDAIAAGPAPVERAGERIARLISIGAGG